VRVIYSVGARFAGGGIGTTALHAAKALHRHGMLTRLLCGSYAPSEIPRDKTRSLGLPSRGLRRLATLDPSGWLWHADSVLFDAWACGRLEPADLFHVWGNFGLRSLRRAKTLGMTTIVQRASTHPLYQARLLQEEYTRWGLTFRTPRQVLRRAVAEQEEADRVLIPSDFVRQSFLAEGFPEHRLLQVPFGVDTGRFQPALGAYGRHPFRVLFVGQVGLRKGVPYLLEAWRRLRWRDAELWLVGRVDRASRRVIERAGDLPGVRFAGYASDPVSLYQQADAFAFPSIEEGSALVTYEALACGLPVVTTPNAGSVVRDGGEGFIVPIRDVDALAARLERLRSDESLRLEMGRAGRQRAQRYTWDRSCTDLCEKLRHLAGADGRPG
jgi:glycosyltransferase involved in cell wall biosynthesis